jgi:hypothetical protein
MTAVATSAFDVVLIVPVVVDFSYPQIALEQNWYVPNFWIAVASLTQSHPSPQVDEVPLP